MSQPCIRDWSLAATSSTAPSPRLDHLAVWTRSGLLIYGGEDEGGPTVSGGVYDFVENEWSFVPESEEGPPIDLVGYSTVWTGQALIVWGGYTSDFELRGWRYDLDGSDWTTTTTIGAPRARAAHMAVWTDEEMVVWGGSEPGGRYRPDSDTWTAMSSTTATTAAFAVWTGAQVLFGDIAYEPASDTWHQMASPPAEVRAPAIWTGAELITTSTMGYPVYAPNSNSWRMLPGEGAPSPRVDFSMSWSGTVLSIWGGRSGDSALNDGARYYPETNSWAPMSLVGAPSSRYGHSAVHSDRGLVIWGGLGTSLLNDTHVYQPYSDP